MPHEPTRHPIEFWFDFGSTYSYLSALRISHLARRAGVAIGWQPFLLGPIFESLGWSTSPFVLQPQKAAYVWDDMRRQCAKYAFPWQRPSVFPRSAVLATRVALHGAREPWSADFVAAIMRGNFARDEDISSEAKVIDVLHELALPAIAIIAACKNEANKPRLREQTARARTLGIFGADVFRRQRDVLGQRPPRRCDRAREAVARGAGPRRFRLVATVACRPSAGR